MRFILITILLFIFTPPSFAESTLEGIKIGDKHSVLDAQHMKIIDTIKYGVKSETTKYSTPDGNELSVTLVNDKVVYIEKDWIQGLGSKKTSFLGFLFGETTLKDIRLKFGTNGFSYKDKAVIEYGGAVVTINCFELTDKNTIILALATKAFPSPEINFSNLDSYLKLDAIILADPQYLDTFWGPGKVYDPNYKKVTP